MNLAGMFKDAHPRGIDFPQPDYEAAKESFEKIAADYGYRLAGVRLGRAVFTTKPLAPVAATTPKQEGFDNGRK